MPASSGGVVCKWTNKDKEDHHLDKKRGPLGFAYPSRIIVCGKQNCGKGVTAINIACTAEPAYETVRFWHYAPEHTKEWEDMQATMVGECPKIEDFPKDKKNLLIIDAGAADHARSSALRTSSVAASLFGKGGKAAVTFAADSAPCAAKLLALLIISASSAALAASSVRGACFDDLIRPSTASTTSCGGRAFKALSNA